MLAPITPGDSVHVIYVWKDLDDPLRPQILVIQEEERCINDRKKPGQMVWLPRMWKFPGGTLKHGETLVQAAIRELEEEVDITLSPHVFDECLHTRLQERHGHAGHFLLFTSFKKRHPVPNEAEGILRAEWFRWDNPIMFHTAHGLTPRHQHAFWTLWEQINWRRSQEGRPCA